MGQDLGANSIEIAEKYGPCIRNKETNNETNRQIQLYYIRTHINDILLHLYSTYMWRKKPGFWHVL